MKNMQPRWCLNHAKLAPMLFLSRRAIAIQNSRKKHDATPKKMTQVLALLRQNARHVLLALTVLGTSVCHAQAHHCAPTAGQSQWQGVVTHYGFVDRALQPFLPKKWAGMNAIRDEVFWDQIQGPDGVIEIPPRIDAFVNEALRHQITPMLVLGYGHPAYDQGGKPRSAQALEAYRRYATHVVKHFRGRVRHFEIWNEWDADTGGGRPGDPDTYLRLVQHIAPALRELDPQLCILVGALTPAARFNGWLDKALAQGLLKHADALSLHTYNYGEGPGKDTPDSWLKDWLWFIQKELPRHPFTSGKPLVMSEMGWSNHSAGVSESLQAAYALRLRLLSLALAQQTANTANPYLGLWWYDWQDDGQDPHDIEHHYGLTDSAGQAKAAWHALKELETFMPVHGSPRHNRAVQMGSVGALTTVRVAVSEGVPATRQRPTTLWAIWHPGNEPSSLSVEMHEDAPRFSGACEARKTEPRKWVITTGAMPCLIQSLAPLQGPAPMFQALAAR